MWESKNPVLLHITHAKTAALNDGKDLKKVCKWFSRTRLAFKIFRLHLLLLGKLSLLSFLFTYNPDSASRWIDRKVCPSDTLWLLYCPLICSSETASMAMYHMSVTGLCWCCWITTAFSFSWKRKPRETFKLDPSETLPYFLLTFTPHAGTCCHLPLLLDLCGLRYISHGSLPPKEFLVCISQDREDWSPTFPPLDIQRAISGSYKEDSKAPRSFAKIWEDNTYLVLSKLL